MDQEVRIETEEPSQEDGAPAQSHHVGLSADQVVNSSPGHKQVHTHIAKPLMVLTRTRGNPNFKWSEEAQEVFDYLKSALLQPPILPKLLSFHLSQARMLPTLDLV